MEFDDNASEVTLGSVISLQSFEDDAPAYGKKQRRRKTKRDQSPYTSRPVSGGLGRSLGKTGGHEAWSAAIRNGHTGLSTENSPANRWAHARGVGKKTKTLSERRGSKGSNSGAFSRDEHILASGKPAYKSPEDYYDEVMELRQVIKQLKTDNGMMKTQLQRITQENVLKDRQIKDFLNPNKQPDEIRRTLTDRKADSSAVVTSLKQKLHLMERNVKDKENELRKLKTDQKSTNMEELRIQCETYFQETQRLQSVLSTVYSQAPGTRNVPQSRMLSSGRSSRENSPRQGFGEVDGDRLGNIMEENRRLQSENRGLKKDLLSAMERPQKGKDKNVDYADMNRVQMLRKITDLEQQLEDAESKAKNSKGKESADNERKKSQKDGEDTELAKQRVVIENLKQDRSHYRDESDKLRSELREANNEIEQLKKEIDLLKENIKSNERLPTSSPPKPLPRQNSRASSAKKSISFQMDKNSSNDEREQDRAARTLQRNWRRHNKKATKEENELAMVAIPIQSILRAHAVRKRRIDELSAEPYPETGDEELDYDDAVTRVQSALRAHRARLKYYKNTNRYEKERRHRDKSEGSDDEERRRWNVNDRLSNRSREDNQSYFNERKSSASSFLSKLKKSSVKRDEQDDKSDDDDDDIVIGGSTHNLSGRRDVKTRAEPSSSRDHKPRPSPKTFGIIPSSSEDDVQMSSRSHNQASTTRKAESGSVFGRSSARTEVQSEKKSTFFGREANDRKKENENFEGTSNHTTIDNLFGPSQPTKSNFNQREKIEHDKDSGSESRKGKPSGQNGDKNEKKSIFSWGSFKDKKSKESTSNSARGKEASSKKKDNSKQSNNVWAPRSAEVVDDDDDDDDVVITPKISRRNPTNAASLLDELF